MQRVLIVEDELDIQESLKIFLENAGYEVETASDGLEGAYKSQKGEYDLILLDVMLPKMDGYAVLEMLRKESTTPVIMLTALGADENQMKGFDLHVDDYIVKPFTINLLLKRIEAILRRSRSNEGKETSHLLVHEEMTLDEKSCEFFVSGKKIALTNKEYGMMHLLMKNPNQVFTRDEILDECWGSDFFGNDYIVSVHMGNLRRKIGGDYIQTVRGRGYKLGKEI